MCVPVFLLSIVESVAGRQRLDLSDLELFAEKLTSKFALPGTASPEDQLKPVVAELLKSAGGVYGLTVETRTETHLSEHKVRPDIAVYVGGLICGYIELKAPGLLELMGVEEGGDDEDDDDE